MNEENNSMRPDQAPDFQPGEKGFAVFLLLIGLFFTWQSVLLYQKVPGASGSGAVPLFCSLLIDVFAITILITDRKRISINSGKPVGEVVRNTLAYLAGRDVVVIVLLVLLYCVAMAVGVPFMVSTSVFLWVGMSYLSRGNYGKNIIWTALCMLFIYLVFQVLFSVVLP